MQWDYANMLRAFYIQSTSSSEPSKYAQYLYDAGGKRTMKIVRSQGGNYSVRLYISEGFEVFYKVEGTTNMGVQNELSVMDDTRRIATIRLGAAYSDDTDPIKYCHADQVESSMLQTNSVGAIENREEYYPFGETSFGSYAKKRYRFSGKEKDEESGMYYYGARYYVAWTCRWASVDPLAVDRNAVTSYNYVQSNPLNKVDPRGSLDHWVESAAGKIYWDVNATSQETTQKGEKYLGANVLVGTHNRDQSGNEEINSATFELYLEGNKDGPSATIKGNTVPSDITKYGTMAEGIYPARFQSRNSYLERGQEDLALIINEGKEIPTLNGNPNKKNSDKLTQIFIHSGNPFAEKLVDSKNKPVWSHGCQTTGSGKGSKAKHDAFMKIVGKSFTGVYYLRAAPKPVTSPAAKSPSGNPKTPPSLLMQSVISDVKNRNTQKIDKTEVYIGPTVPTKPKTKQK